MAKRRDTSSGNGHVVPDRLLWVDEAAAMLGIEPATLYQWAYERRIPVVKPNGPRGPVRWEALDLAAPDRGVGAPRLGADAPTPLTLMHALGYMWGVKSIKRVRKELGLTLKAVGDRAGLHDEAVARIEHPDVDPRASSLVKIARAMGVPICALFDEPGHTHGQQHPHAAPPRRPKAR